MKDTKIKIGETIYTTLKNNSSKVWSITIFATIISICSLAFSFYVYLNSANNLYGINDKGEMQPLKKLEEKQADLIQAKANIELFVNYFYNIDAYNMKSRRERVRWLLGEQPTKIIVDKEKRGYFDEFLAINGLRQNAYILQNTLKINNEPPYNADFVVRIERINGKQIRYYNAQVNITMAQVNKNYPYNPYGLLITDFKEAITEIIEVNQADLDLQLQESENAINQNAVGEQKQTQNEQGQ